MTEKIKEYQRQYYLKNKQKSIEYQKKNRERINKVAREYRKKRMENDILFKLNMNIRNSIRQSFYNKSLKKKKISKNILGCSFEEFKLYLESKFENWMNWENRSLYNGQLNYGWDIDHIIPLSYAKTEEDLYKLNHYTNLQPLCSFTNRVLKKDKMYA